MQQRPLRKWDISSQKTTQQHNQAVYDKSITKVIVNEKNLEVIPSRSGKNKVDYPFHCFQSSILCPSQT